MTSRFIDLDENELAALQEPPEEPTWQTIAEVTGLSNPLFEASLFAIGYDFTSNVYLIRGDYLSIIDPGNDYLIYMELFRQGIKPTDIKKIAITHGHPDHCMGVMELFRGYPGIAQDLDVEVIMHESGPMEFKEILEQGGIRYTEVKGGETINLSGFDLEVIHTPGHTLDGLCYYHTPTKTLFSGDTVLTEAMADMDQGGGGRIDHYLYALRTLRKLEIEHVMPGHGGIAPLVGQRVVRDTYEGLIRKVIDEGTPWMAGAMALAQQGQLEEALFCCQKVLAEEPDNLRALETKAFLLKDLGRDAEALDVFNQVLAQKPEHFYAFIGKGMALMAQEKFSEALESFDKALLLQPGNKEILINKGLALYLSGRQDEALEIQPFQEAFADKIKEELSQHQSQSPASES
jgi:hydroxyacylglutathione hydrolase